MELSTVTPDVTQRLRSTRVGRAFLKHKLAYLFVSAPVLMLVLAMWLPFVRGIYISFFQWPIVGENTWIGLDWYTYYLFEWEPFWTTVKVTVFQTLMVFPQVALALAVTLALYHTARFQNLLNSVFLLPYVIPPVASGTLLWFFLDPDIGPMWAFLQETGIVTSPVFWKTTGDSALMVILGATIWTFWPWVLLILMSSRAAIDDGYYEAGKMYGASRFQMFRHITLPQLKGALLVVISLRTIYNLVNTAQIWQMTRGGPGYDTTPLGLLVFRSAFEEGAMGRAFAAGMFLLIIGLILAIGFFVMFERSASEVEEAMSEV